MAKTLQINGRTVTTDEDWYEIDAFGKRLGPRYLNGQAPSGGNAAPGTGWQQMGGGATGLPAGGGGGDAGAFETHALPALQGLLGGGRETDGDFPDLMPVQNINGPSSGNPQLGNRILPLQQLELAMVPRRLY